MPPKVCGAKILKDLNVLCFRIIPIFIKNKTNSSQNPKLKTPNQFYNYNVVVGLVEFGTRATWV